MTTEPSTQSIELCSEIIDDIIQGLGYAQSHTDTLYETIDAYKPMVGETPFRFLSSVFPDQVHFGKKKLKSERTVLSLSDLPSHRVGQMKVLRQRKNNACGYYCLKNSVLAFFIQSMPQDVADELASDFLNMYSFYHRFEEMKTVLKLEADVRQTPWYPWTHRIIDQGVLEREYIDHLLEDEKWINLSKLDTFGITNLCDFGINSLKYNKLSTRRMESLHNTFMKFKNKDVYSHSFVMGLTNHWLVIYVQKIGDEVETLILDSRNNFVLEKSKEELTDVIIQRILKAGTKIEELKEDKYQQWVQSLVETRFLTELIHDCAIQKKKIKPFLVNYNVEGFLESFREHANSENDDEFLMEFYQWLSDYFPPAIIEQNIVTLLDKYHDLLTEQTKNDLGSWLSELTQRIDLDQELFSRFKTTYEELSKQLF
eukprot:TRINITY_DN1340_c0_g1_i2.p1 TRINITY_DN1340_c0_g1~~TRINITY_DN1340_c0_g1_i2.p1  ORF type:complete len:427 (-),score=76.54 TRINITY_DN1340_c0_g1_i2:41-1321(-)